jgi:hypothetical protein
LRAALLSMLPWADASEAMAATARERMQAFMV